MPDGLTVNYVYTQTILDHRTVASLDQVEAV